MFLGVHVILVYIPICPINFLSKASNVHSKTRSLQSKGFLDYQLFYSTKHLVHAFHTILVVPEPMCFFQASKSPKWKKAELVEYEALFANETWVLCHCPINRRIIINKWVFKHKQNQDGSIECYKARLVANGFNQQCGVDYT